MPATRHLLSSVLALLALGALLAPIGGGTRAAWSAGASVPVPPLTNDTVAITVAPEKTDPPLPAEEMLTVPLTVHNESRRWAAAVTPSASVAPLGPDLGLGELVDVTYRDCQASAPLAGPLAVPASDSAVLCAEITTAQTDAELLLNHAGQGVTLTHQVTREPTAGTAWTAYASTVTTHILDFPRPTHPGAELTPNGVCSAGVLSATIKWAWPDTASHTSISSPAVSHWQLQHLDSGQWVNTGGTINASARSATVSRGLLELLSSPTFRVVGYPEADPSVPIAGTYQVTIHTLLSVLGIPIGTTCAGVGTLP